LTVFFNDPVPCPDPAHRAVRMAVAMRERTKQLAETWSRRGHDLSLGVGIAEGFATLGRIGFEGRFDYAAIGSVTNLASRLCAEAEPWQILIPQRVQALCEAIVVCEPVGDLELRGFANPVRAYHVRGINAAVSE
jgi:class 3 adenylate cyclase